MRTALCCLAGIALVAMAGCSGAARDASSDGSEDATSGAVGAAMAGAVVDVNVTPEAFASKPQPWVLTTPESAVRSYLGWTSYAYRIGSSTVATATMTMSQEVRVDSYTQLNLEKERVIDQKLTSITFGTPSIEGSRAVVSAKEEWTYSYVSIQTAGKIVGGPYPASYDTTYTVVRSGQDWVVDSVKVTRRGPLN